MASFEIYYFGEPSGGEFSLCSGDYCTGPLPWNATSAMVAEAVGALGPHVSGHSGGPLPTPITLEVDTEDLTADEANSLSTDTAQAYFGGPPISVIVAAVEQEVDV